MTHFIRTAIAAQYSVYQAYILEPVVSVKYWDCNLHAALTFMFCKLENFQRRQHDAWAKSVYGMLVKKKLQLLSVSVLFTCPAAFGGPPCTGNTVRST